MTLVNNLLAGCISIAMLYTGLLFDPAWANRGFLLEKLRPFGAMALANYVAVPLLTLALVTLVAMNPTLSLTLLILAALPCAPLVPALATLAGEAPEWPLFIFLGFSLLSLLVVVALIAGLSGSATHGDGIGADTATKLFHYVLLVYGPMMLGALLRRALPVAAARMVNPVRALTGLALVGVMALFATVHREEFAAVAATDLLIVLAFTLGCAVLGALCAPFCAGQRLTATFATGFRNIALAIAFATVVLRRPDVTAYLVVYSGITLSVCGAAMAAWKLAAHRAVAR